MLKFVSRERETPEKRAAEERRKDFDEIYARFADARAAEQAGRCSQCGVPFCQDHCPLGNDIPDWLRLVAEGRLEEAYAVSAATNNMPEVCGRICPQDRLCEGACVIEQSGHGTVTIGAVEQYITETAFEKGWVKPIRPDEERAQSVGIVGAGPAGLAAAEQLREQGFQVTVYDRYDRAGGLLVYGIPNFKLDKAVVARRVARLEEGGVAFALNFEVGRDAGLAELRARHDAILIATGVYKARELSCPGAGEAHVVAALDYLTASNRKGLGDAVADFDSGRLDADGKRVVVIGGGDTAMDCVRTAVRQGAASVRCLYRRDRANMPGSQREVAHAEEEGVVFEWLAGPKAVAARRVRAARMRLGAPDASGRSAPEEIPDGGFELEADLVVKALGFEPEDLPRLFGEPALAVTRRGTLKVDPATLETALPGVYAAGDIVRGASLVVWAIRDGRVAAAAIAERLGARATATPALVAAE
ncbi:glutamate synthase (NADPH) small subunit [Amphiplicatus metriothermophilus]|uniref:Glutamate synthase (NADPH) small subunit n=2 Tax=Amphiplicatus metriothermophilus TaxID=1519374 RepID=A0A239PLM3_9PROT|nr:glutamate synthase (NADPH) small subunit [Amphiplicatus metriothermophilus]